MIFFKQSYLSYKSQLYLASWACWLLLYVSPPHFPFYVKFLPRLWRVAAWLGRCWALTLSAWSTIHVAFPSATEGWQQSCPMVWGPAVFSRLWLPCSKNWTGQSMNVKAEHLFRAKEGVMEAKRENKRWMRVAGEHMAPVFYNPCPDVICRLSSQNPTWSHPRRAEDCMVWLASSAGLARFSGFVSSISLIDRPT